MYLSHNRSRSDVNMFAWSRKKYAVIRIRNIGPHCTIHDFEICKLIAKVMFYGIFWLFNNLRNIEYWNDTL
jgi:hypothetical protein